MIFLMDPEFWARLLGIVIIDLTLAGDNALVIALAVRTLPQRQQFWGRVWGAAGGGGPRPALLPVAAPLPPLPAVPPRGRAPLLWSAGTLPPTEARGEKHGPTGGC